MIVSSWGLACDFLSRVPPGTCLSDKEDFITKSLLWISLTLPGTGKGEKEEKESQ